MNKLFEERKDLAELKGVVGNMSREMNQVQERVGHLEKWKTEVDERLGVTEREVLIQKETTEQMALALKAEAMKIEYLEKMMKTDSFRVVVIAGSVGLFILFLFYIIGL